MTLSIESIKNVEGIKNLAKDALVDKSFLDLLFSNLTLDNERIVYNSTWILSHAFEIEKNSNIEKYFPVLIKVALSTRKGGIKRNIIKILQLVQIPENFQLDCVDLAFKFLSNPKEDIAVRAFAITVLENLASKYPEIIEEVLFILEREKPFASSAFFVRSKRFEKSAIKIISNLK